MIRISITIAQNSHNFGLRFCTPLYDLFGKYEKTL